MYHQDSNEDAYYSPSESRADTSTFIETDAQINEAIKSSFCLTISWPLLAEAAGASSQWLPLIFVFVFTHY